MRKSDLAALVTEQASSRHWAPDALSWRPAPPAADDAVAPEEGAEVGEPVLIADAA
jgi:hypothetical protein